MKIFKYLITTFAFSTQAVSFNFTQEHCDYFEKSDADHRTYFVLATIYIHDQCRNNAFAAQDAHEAICNMQQNTVIPNKTLSFFEIIQSKCSAVADAFDKTFQSFANDDIFVKERTLFSRSVFSAPALFDNEADLDVEPCYPEITNMTIENIEALLYASSCCDDHINVHSDIDIQYLPMNFQNHLIISSLNVGGKINDVNQHLPSVQTEQLNEVVFAFFQDENCDYVKQILKKVSTRAIKVILYGEVSDNYPDSILETIGIMIENLNIEFEVENNTEVEADYDNNFGDSDSDYDPNDGHHDHDHD